MPGFVLAVMLAAAPANATQVMLDQLRAQDETVGNIGHRLARGGLSLCPGTVEPIGGLRVHILTQYGKAFRADAARLFGLGRYPAILTLAPDGAAARAGLKAGDWIVSINGADLSGGAGYDGVARFSASFRTALASPPATLVIERAGVRSTVAVTGLPGCASDVELVPGRKLNAAADGRIVQLTTGVLAEAKDDDELAFLIAHEMAHNILRHKERLDRTGRSNANILATEKEADELGLKLMKAAGYDPFAGARFWTHFGRKTGAGIFSDGTHMRTKARVAFLQSIANGLRGAQ